MGTIRLRLAALADADAIAAIYAPYVRDTAISFETEPPSPGAMAERIAEYGRDYPFLVAEGDGGMLGYAYAHRQMQRQAYQWNAEVSVYLDVTARGRGLGRLLYGRLLEILSLQGVINLYALLVSPNAPSERLHLHFGFERIGLHPATGFKHGRWHDVAWYGKRIGNPEGTPPPVIPITMLGERVAEILSRPFTD